MKPIIHNIQSFLIAVNEGIKIGFAQQRTYIPRLFAWLIADMFQFGVMVVILSAALKDNPNFTSNEILIYYLLVLVVGLLLQDRVRIRRRPGRKYSQRQCH